MRRARDIVEGGEAMVVLTNKSVILAVIKRRVVIVSIAGFQWLISGV